ncbi:D-alanine--poly(phosphoribitol) ligase subunit DltA [Lactovum odontotermitis]
MNLLEQILSIAKEYPERIALAEKERSYSYRELFTAISQISDEIRNKNLSKRPVLVFGKNDFITLAAMLAANLTGRAYIPVDAHTPFERIEMIYKAANPSAVVATTLLAAEFEALFPDKISASLTESLNEEDKSFPEIDLSSSVSGSDSCYIIYTSGTTGTPKGVEVSHDNLKSFTNWMNHDFEQIEQNQILSQALYSFDLSIFSLYPSLTTGGTLVSLSREETTNFKLLFDRLNAAKTKINTWISTPSFVDICLLDPSFTQEKHPELQQFIFCGEELTAKTAAKLLKAFPEASVFNSYGPTEATGAISSIKITAEIISKVLAENERLPIGYAKPGVELQIIEDEIIIIGDSVAKGYFENSNEAVTRAFFMLDGKSAYHTGDAGSISFDGLLHYQGRIDFQIKMNGFRIELQDIEANLQKLAEVDGAVVLPQFNDQHKVTALTAYIKTPRSFSEKAVERAFTKEIKQELSHRIMDYMMPARFIYLKEFPLNQNGKVDRKGLEAQASKERGE